MEAGNSDLTSSSHQLNARNELENILNNDMFNNLFNLYEANESVTKDSDTESDDSFAASFSQCMHKLVVFSSREKLNLINANDEASLNGCGGLFRVVTLRNTLQDQLYAFIILVKDLDEVKQSKDTNVCAIRNDEIYLWWR